MRWSSVDWDARRIRLHVKDDRYHEVVITEGIERLLRGAKGWDGELVWTSTHFGGEHGGERLPVSYVGFGYAFRRICRNAGVSNLTIHDLRRTAGERMYRVTGDIAAASKFLGHSSIELTRRHYVDVLVDDVEERQIAMEEARQKRLCQIRAREKEAEEAKG